MLLFLQNSLNIPHTITGTMSHAHVYRTIILMMFRSRSHVIRDTVNGENNKLQIQA